MIRLEKFSKRFSRLFFPRKRKRCRIFRREFQTSIRILDKPAAFALALLLFPPPPRTPFRGHDFLLWTAELISP